MKKIYIIIVSPELNNELIRERIKMIGPNYIFWDNHWLVSSAESAKEIYQKLSSEEFSLASIFVSELKTENYFGRMNTTLWDWMKKATSK